MPRLLFRSAPLGFWPTATMHENSGGLHSNQGINNTSHMYRAQILYTALL